MSHEYEQVNDGLNKFAGTFGGYVAYVKENAGNAQVKAEAERLVQSLRDKAEELSSVIER